MTESLELIAELCFCHLWDMPISYWELWACANKMMETHGKDAAIRAAMNADLLLKKGDLDGHQAWLAIMRRIKELEQIAPQASVH